MSCTAFTLSFLAKDFLKLEKNMIKEINYTTLMTTAVTFARQKNILPLLFAVPLFIVCGFTHCVADAFYYMTIPFSSWSLELLGVYACTVLGNLIGCNLYRIVLAKDQHEQA